MALSAFKSTTKRGTNPNGPDPSKQGNKGANRRSRSVSAVSRANGPSSSKSSSSNLSVSDEFLIKRDNPLYCCSSSSSSSSPDEVLEGSGRRGRSFSRSSEVGKQGSGGCRNEKTVRSLSRVDPGRRRMRSVSRGRYGKLETDVGQRYNSISSLRSNEVGRSTTSKGQRQSVVTDTEFDAKEKARNLQKWTSRHPISGSWDASSSCSQGQNWEDGISTSSFSEAEETLASERDNPPIDVGSGAIYETVRSEVCRAVSEICDNLENAIWRKQPSIFSTENIEDTSPEFVNTDEIVTHMRSEYVSRLEQAQERARKLRADLAIEEQREQELSRILEEIAHAPRNSDCRKSHPKRKTSIERQRMSRRLAEEAMNYFDECVSLSTFDSSDFSSLEDPQPTSTIGVSIATMGSSRFSPSEGSKDHSVSDFTNHHEELDNQTQCSHSIQESDLALSSCSSSKAGSLIHANGSHNGLLYNFPQSEDMQESFARDKMKAVGAHDIRHYIQKFEKGQRKDRLENVNVKSRYNPEEYDLSAKSESLVFDHLILRNRIDSGGLLLCNLRIF
ncbi:uncharacterized protein A4U43_C02F12840 [Asparagus officinalis]|uniref:Uncharacterized protein n=1 Tax=Asparagus officinalis TaxID=4686 RepID=A0A5P1FMW9_ASPOF|nr:uncharacterized protein LOC109830689 [Asparagus officinalis]ONK77970.1 uncharacterized protein A4U43_C02F12840 [Asparagus officinalis]